MRALDRFDARRPFAPWINRIVVNRAIDFARARTLRREVGAELAAPAEAPADEPRISDDLMRRWPRSRRAARRGGAPLPARLDARRDSPGPGLPRGTVNSRLRRALDRLADTVEDER